MCTNTTACHNILLLQYQQTCTVAVKAISHSPVKQKTIHLLSLYWNNKFLFHLNTYPFRYSAGFFFSTHSSISSFLLWHSPSPPLSFYIHVLERKIYPFFTLLLTYVYTSSLLPISWTPFFRCYSTYTWSHPSLGWFSLAQSHQVLEAKRGQPWLVFVW